MKVKLTNPALDKYDIYRVRRGGEWGDSAGVARASDRSDNVPSLRLSGIGFRLVKNKD